MNAIKLALYAIMLYILMPGMNASERSYYQEFSTAHAHIVSGSSVQAQRALMPFVECARCIKKEYNVIYALRAAEMLLESFDDLKSCRAIIDAIIRRIIYPTYATSQEFLYSCDYILDASIYQRLARLSHALDRSEYAELFQEKAQKQIDNIFKRKTAIPRPEIDFEGMEVRSYYQ